MIGGKKQSICLASTNTETRLTECRTKREVMRQECVTRLSLRIKISAMCCKGGPEDEKAQRFFPTSQNCFNFLIVGLWDNMG
jgi:hypothetical protein